LGKGGVFYGQFFIPDYPVGKNRKDVCGRCLRRPGKRLKIWEKRQFEETSQWAAFGRAGPFS
jgi:hypothetical protein